MSRDKPRRAWEEVFEEILERHHDLWRRMSNVFTPAELEMLDTAQQLIEYVRRLEAEVAALRQAAHEETKP